MMSLFRIFLAASVALTVIMASGPTRIQPGGQPGGGPGPLGVTRFVCAHCTATGELSSRGLFLNRASVRRHIAASQACRAANLGVREIHVEARAGDVMAGAGGAAGPAPDVRHQPAGTCHLISIPGNIKQHKTKLASTLMAQWSKEPRSVHEVVGSNPTIVHQYAFLAETSIYRHIL